MVKVTSSESAIGCLIDLAMHRRSIADRLIIRSADHRLPIRPLVLLLEDVRGVQVERGRGARVGAAELGVAAVADGQVLQPPVDDEIDERRRRRGCCTR